MHYSVSWGDYGNFYLGKPMVYPNKIQVVSGRQRHMLVQFENTKFLDTETRRMGGKSFIRSSSWTEAQEIR